MTDQITFAKAIADGTRQRIMKSLCRHWLCVNDVVDQLNSELPNGITQPTVSHHLSILRDADLVETRREGKQIFYTLNQETVAKYCGKLMENFAPGK